ncbi:GNAT family N-acetyltransferase [Cellulosimicrobium arenosum]|uniref:GNAT family N-acetyltransferase n=1 Tax=Cellulosimicrobium arenosum TaxID=2708133 RepID=A0A927J1X4_9MICO|nr:GNAT family N-acetyltransferase [Cellulosimicrobium arenosum]MBD8080429.1 GNAT family N-acetyltransferase [Cellulosimicrobium arenosum]
MAIVLETPGVDGLTDVVGALRTWQDDDAPLQLHPGDLGWFWRFGAEATAAAVRTWRRGGQLLAVGLLDGPGLLRLAISPDGRQDEELARRLADDAARPERGVLADGEACVEAPVGALVDDRLGEVGWASGEPWTLLRRDLEGPVQDPGIQVDTVTAEQAPEWARVLRGSFDGSTSTVDRWSTMAAGPAFADARCLLAHDRDGDAVAVVAVWAAGPGRPGLVEPLGVHRDFRGRGHGRAVTLAAAGALRQMGSSSVIVATPSDNLGAVATYESAGFRRLPERRDRCRPGAADEGGS